MKQRSDLRHANMRRFVRMDDDHAARRETTTRGFAMTDERPVPPGLSPFWTGTVQQFAELPPNVFTPEEQERHRIYSLLLMGVIYGKWSGNKYGEIGDYGEWRSAQEIGSTTEGLKIYAGGSYLGHNIAALAVDAEGRIIDFDFNHNQVFDSTVEHAESRLVRRVF